MSEPFLGEIRMVGFNFAPRGWATCDGQLLPIAQNSALYSLLGTIYGGNGNTTFALPDLRGRVPILASAAHPIGSRGGQEAVALTEAELPGHSHPIAATTASSDASSAVNALPAVSAREVYGDVRDAVVMASESSPAGSGFHHDNMQPFQVVNFCIALVGIYPSRS